MFPVPDGIEVHVSPTYVDPTDSLSYGSAEPEPPLQKYPAAHGPLGADNPLSPQNAPGVQGEHSSSVESCVKFPYVPTGHGN